MEYTNAQVAGSKKICEGELPFEGLAAGAARLVATWPLADAQRLMSEAAVEAVRKTPEIAKDVGEAARIYYTLGEPRDEGARVFVPYTVWVATSGGPSRTRTE